MLGDQAHALEVLLEVALGQPLALGDHAEAVGARGLGRARVLEDLLGLHHRVHRRLGVGEARLGAEAAVLGAAARLGVDQRAHVGRVGEPLHARLPGALDERFDLRVVLDLAELERLLAGDQRRHAPHVTPAADGWSPSRSPWSAGVTPRASAAGVSRRTRACPRACPREANEARRSSISSSSTSGASSPSAAQQRGDHALVADLRQRRVAGELAGQLERDRLQLGAAATRLTRPQASAVGASM